MAAGSAHGVRTERAPVQFRAPSPLLVRVVAPHFVAGFIVTNDRVTEAAPIIRYLVGWESKRVRDYIARKGWRASVVLPALATEQGATQREG